MVSNGDYWDLWDVQELFSIWSARNAADWLTKIQTSAGPIYLRT